MTAAPVAPAATIVVFGATGDLTRRLLVPALVNLQRARLLDPKTRILGVSHSEGDDEALRDRLDEFVEDDAEWRRLRERIAYLCGDFADASLYASLARRLGGNVVFYLAVAPSFFVPVTDGLGKAGLLDEADGFRRIIVEKPFGNDLASARKLNARLLAQAREEQIYRIDHFLGKETVQNVLALRFGNALSEAVWNNRYVDHVQITAAEAVAVGGRGAFYDATGALRDMVPNHLFQLLALVCMEPPSTLDAEALRTEKAKVIAAVRPVKTGDAVRGRYRGSNAGGAKIPGYRDTPDVAADSITETYAALKLSVETQRWHGVPFYLRTGKALAARDTEIVIRFRDTPLHLFADNETIGAPPNQFVLQIQPSEGLSLEIAVKPPGPLFDLMPASLDLAYADLFDLSGRTGYETLLYDVLTGDQSLFQRADQIEAGWRAVAPLLKAWRNGEPEDYAAGSDGPDGAARLIERDGRVWHPIA